jgi:hypothetical protein
MSAGEEMSSRVATAAVHEVFLSLHLTLLLCLIIRWSCVPHVPHSVLSCECLLNVGVVVLKVELMLDLGSSVV